MHSFIELTFFSALPHVAAASLMYGREIVRVGRAADENWWSSWPSRVAAEDFSVMSVMAVMGKG